MVLVIVSVVRQQANDRVAACATTSQIEAKVDNGLANGEFVGHRRRQARGQSALRSAADVLPLRSGTTS